MKTNEKIQDFGKKIGGARKDYYQSMKEAAERFSSVTEELLTAQSVAKVASLPSLERMSQAGAISAENARAALVAWRSMPPRPSNSWKLTRWAQKAVAVCNRIGAILAGDTISDEEQGNPEYKVLTAANWPASPFSFGLCSVVRLRSWGEPCDVFRVVRGGYYKGEATSDPAVLLATILDINKRDAEKRAEGCKLAVYVTRAGEYFVAPDGNGDIILFKGTRDECRDQVNNHAEELRERLAALRTFPELRRDWNRPRVGTDWRGGVDVTPEKFAAAIPFGGVEFGNWLNQTERASMLNSAFDGFHDLAEMLGIPVGAIALGGSLSFAFGSRGIAHAAAHYEPGRQVINLTKKSGAGCMAHEWFHACDHFALYGSGQKSQTTAATSSHIDTPAGVAAAAIVTEIKKTDFYTRSANLAKYRGKYWIDPAELAARGFEGVAAFLLNASGVCSDFLVNCISMDEFTAADTEGRSNFYPYPTATESAALAPYYLEFFRALFGAAPALSDAARIKMAEAQAEAEAERVEAEAKREREKKEAQQRREEEANRREAERAAAGDVMAEKAKAMAEAMTAAGVRGVVWSATPLEAYALGYIGDRLFSRSVAGSGHVHEVAVKYTKNARLKRGARYSWRSEAIESTEATAREFVEAAARDTFDGVAAGWSGSVGADVVIKTAPQFSTASEYAAALAEAKCNEPTTPTESEGMSGAAYGDGQKLQPATDAAPAEGLELVNIAGGVAVVGDERTTYRNRKAIKAHGATWNGSAKQWQATTAEAVVALREWFGVANEAAPAEDASTTDTAPAAAPESYADCQESQPAAAPAEDAATVAADAAYGTAEKLEAAAELRRRAAELIAEAEKLEAAAAPAAEASPVAVAAVYGTAEKSLPQAAKVNNAAAVSPRLVGEYWPYLPMNEGQEPFPLFNPSEPVAATAAEARAAGAYIVGLLYKAGDTIKPAPTFTPICEEYNTNPADLLATLMEMRDCGEITHLNTRDDFHGVTVRYCAGGGWYKELFATTLPEGVRPAYHLERQELAKWAELVEATDPSTNEAKATA